MYVISKCSTKKHDSITFTIGCSNATSENAYFAGDEKRGVHCFIVSFKNS